MNTTRPCLAEARALPALSVRPRARALRLGALSVPVGGLALSLALSLLLATTAVRASAAEGPVGLGTAGSYAVLAGTTVTNTGPSNIGGDLGVSPGTAVVGFPPGQVNNGTIQAATAVALQAQSDVTTAYNDAAGRTPAVDQTDPDVGGQTLMAGVYRTASAMALSGTVTLDAQGDPDAVFIFQAGSTLITASNSTVALIGGAQACHVYWQVGSSATLGTGTTFVGTVLALTSISMQTGANLHGRALARNGAVTLDTNTITRSDCAAPSTEPSPTATATPTDTPAPTTTAVPTPTTSPTGGPSTATPTTPGGTGGTSTPGGPSTPATTGPGGGGGGGGNGSGGPGGPGTPKSPASPESPRIPTGHPHTGRSDTTPSSGTTWLLLALLSLAGASGAGFLGWKGSAPPARRRP